METKDSHLCLLRVLLLQRKDHLTRSVQCERKDRWGRFVTSTIFLAQKGGKEMGLVEEWGLNFLYVSCLSSFPYSLWPFPFHWCLCPLQGLILLQGNQVNELPPNPDEPGKHLFEIAPGRPAFPCTFNIISSHSHRLSLIIIELYWSLNFLAFWYTRQII